MGSQDVLTRSDIDRELESLPHWRYLGPLQAVYTCPSSAAALQLLAAIGELAEAANHHPDVDWRYDTVYVSTLSHDAHRKVTARDVALAHAISEAATAAQAQPRPELIRSYELAIDSSKPAAIAAVWQKGFGYEAQEDGSLFDPQGRGPAVWFQQTATPNANRIHVDVQVPMSERAAAIAAVEAAGAALDHSNAPSWTVATDAQGNRLCICTEAEADGDSGGDLDGNA